VVWGLARYHVSRYHQLACPAQSRSEQTHLQNVAINNINTEINFDIQSLEMSTKATKEPRVPEPGSLRHLLIAHSSKRLYVAPLEWSAENLNLIDWPPPHTIPMSAAARNNSPNPHPSSEDLRVIVALETLRYLKVESRRDESIRQLFRLLVPKQVFKISRCAKPRGRFISNWF
jgi:hypothetical protein